MSDREAIAKTYFLRLLAEWSQAEASLRILASGLRGLAHDGDLNATALAELAAQYAEWAGSRREDIAAMIEGLGEIVERQAREERPPRLRWLSNQKINLQQRIERRQ